MMPATQTDLSRTPTHFHRFGGPAHVGVLCLLVLGCGSQATNQPGRKASTEPNPARNGQTNADLAIDSQLIELGRIANAASIGELATSLSSKDPNVRRQASLSLGIAAKMGGDLDAITTPLRSALSSERVDSVVAALIWGLARSGAAADVDLISEFSSKTGPGRRSATVDEAVGLALGVLGRREISLSGNARRVLVELSGHAEPDVRFAAAYGLAREHQPPVDALAIRALVGLLGSTDFETRATAVYGLGARKREHAAVVASLADVHWTVSVESVRALLKENTTMGNRELSKWVVAKRPKTSAKLEPALAHPLRVALFGFAERPADNFSRRAARSFAYVQAAYDLDAGQLKCLGTAIVNRSSGGPSKIRDCAKVAVPRWWSEQLTATALADSTFLSANLRRSELAKQAKHRDPRVRAAAVAAFIKVADGELRGDALTAIATALVDPSPAVVGTAADGLAELKLSDEEKPAIHAALTTRADKELSGNTELAQTLAAAIGKNSIASGADACLAASANPNRSVALAGRECLSALKQEAPPSSWTPDRPMPSEPVAAGSIWVVETTRGVIRIALEPQTAPRHVSAVAQLTGQKFYDGTVFHRVVPNFVIQGGDPTATGWGGPGFDVPAEPSALPFDRGAVGIADAGPDTGGSQWFVMHSRAPHLEGRYTRIGRVIEGMDVVDKITVGDKIAVARIESGSF